MKILFCGCSFTAGTGLPGGKDNPQLWTNQLAARIKSTKVDNAAMVGRNNYWIFLETLHKILNNRYDIVIVAWSAIPRYYFHIGLELYDVHTMLKGDEIGINIVNQEKISGKWLHETGDRLRRFHNDHWDIVELIKYINVLLQIQTSQNGQIFFVNALCPWGPDFFVKKSITLPAELDSYTYNLLQCDLRSDQEIFKLYDMIHRHYAEYGSIKAESWLNLYNGLHRIKVDSASAIDNHPGIESQKIFVEYLWKSLEQKI